MTPIRPLLTALGLKRLVVRPRSSRPNDLLRIRFARRNPPSMEIEIAKDEDTRSIRQRGHFEFGSSTTYPPFFPSPSRTRFKRILLLVVSYHRSGCHRFTFVSISTYNTSRLISSRHIGFGLDQLDRLYHSHTSAFFCYFFHVASGICVFCPMEVANEQIVWDEPLFKTQNQSHTSEQFGENYASAVHTSDKGTTHH